MEGNFGYLGLLKEICRRLKYGATLMQEFDQVLVENSDPKHQQRHLVAMTQLIYFFCLNA
jgi:hypothetical protein